MNKRTLIALNNIENNFKRPSLGLTNLRNMHIFEIGWPKTSQKIPIPHIKNNNESRRSIVIFLCVSHISIISFVIWTFDSKPNICRSMMMQKTKYPIVTDRSISQIYFVAILLLWHTISIESIDWRKEKNWIWVEMNEKEFRITCCENNEFFGLMICANCFYLTQLALFIEF